MFEKPNIRDMRRHQGSTLGPGFGVVHARLHDLDRRLRSAVREEHRDDIADAGRGRGYDRLEAEVLCGLPDRLREREVVAGDVLDCDADCSAGVVPAPAESACPISGKNPIGGGVVAVDDA